MATRRFTSGLPPIGQAPFRPRVLYFGRSHAGQGPAPGRTPYFVTYEPARRVPRKGEWFLSGAIPEGYLMPTDAGTQEHVIIVRGARIETAKPDLRLV